MADNEERKEISTEQFNYFKERIFYWQKRLGAVEYHFNVSMEDLDYANATFDVYEKAKLVIIKIDKYLVDDLRNSYSIDMVAFHEVFESVYFTDFVGLLDQYDESVIDSLRHKQVRRAENSFFDDLR